LPVPFSPYHADVVDLLPRGRPSIKGISTEVIWEQDEVGLDVVEIADMYQLCVADVRWALAYENSQRAA
jgi:uncharacterized protein (DUF433 family)